MGSFLKDHAPWPPTPQQVVVWLLLAAGVVLILIKMLVAPATEAPVIVAARDLPAYTQLAAGDVLTKTLSLADIPANAVTVPSAVISRLITSDIRGGDPIKSGALVSPTANTRNWLIVSVPLSATATLRPGTPVLLYGVPEETRQATLITDQALVLNVDGTTVVLGGPPDGMLDALGYLVDNRLLVVRRVP
ncbi:MAG: SAF domain-containing protein [Caldilinea sp.]|nr:SAF domain-containing protein [Caldilinea sp.]MCB0151198.1 SAF domain-containing protein [Caldilineaceae bacterium]MCB0048257.1 SAF domain-containing protein [Caldilinea sp.]MCB9123501.1 SAF domain-containing protein [Caldilineaceae bacterium]MCO5214386.1 SAF domain-containing protein [Caldilinea sp.]